MRKILKILRIISFIFFLFVMYTIYYISIQKENIKNKEIKVSKGKVAKEIYSELNIKYGIIDRMFFKFSKESKKIKTGKYKFDVNLTRYELIKKLQAPKINSISLTIPEGFTTLQVLERMESVGLAKKSNMLEELSNYKFYYKHNKLFEGYFYPETYYFSDEETPREILDKIFGQFLEKFPIRQYDKDKFYNTIILASIIEKEAGKNDDRTKISAVFNNRLKINMPLQSDATLRYDLNRTVYKNDLMNSNSKYNTYKHKGLIPSPICNPGYNSIIAALNPSKIDSLYFFMSNGKTYYSKTHKEHLRKRRESGQIK